MEYTNKRIKKEGESESLGYFIEAYETILGESFISVEPSERPDFVAIRKDGGKVGIELSRITRGNPNVIQYDKLIEKQDYMSVYDALQMIQRQAAEKEEKRDSDDWTLPAATILILELTDIPLSELVRFIGPDRLPDLYDTGFIEVWLMDLTGLEAYDNTELFCVYPDELQGYYSKSIQKPYS